VGDVPATLEALLGELPTGRPDFDERVPNFLLDELLSAPEFRDWGNEVALDQEASCRVARGWLPRLPELTASMEDPRDRVELLGRLALLEVRAASWCPEGPETAPRLESLLGRLQGFRVDLAGVPPVTHRHAALLQDEVDELRDRRHPEARELQELATRWRAALGPSDPAP